MRHILEYDEHGSQDKLRWGDQIKSAVKKSLTGKPLKGGYELKDVKISKAESKEFSTAIGGDYGTGIVELYFKKSTPDELDQLISDLSLAGHGEDKRIDLKYEISVDPKIDGDESHILVRVNPIETPNFMGIGFKVYADNDYDMTYGVGSPVAEEIRKQII
jgi:hypothetical protein